MTAAHNPPGPNFKTGPLGWGRPVMTNNPAMRNTHWSMLISAPSCDIEYAYIRKYAQAQVLLGTVSIERPHAIGFAAPWTAQRASRKRCLR